MRQAEPVLVIDGNASLFSSRRQFKATCKEGHTPEEHVFATHLSKRILNIGSQLQTGERLTDERLLVGALTLRGEYLLN